MVAVAVALAGCGGSSSKSTSTSATTHTSAALACNPATGFHYGQVFVSSGAAAGYLGVEDIITAFPYWVSGQSVYARGPKTPLCPAARKAMAAVIIDYVAHHKAAIIAASDPKPRDPVAFLKHNGVDCGSECSVAGAK